MALNTTTLMIAAMSMAMDFGWKVFNEKTKNMTPDELEQFVLNKKVSVAQTEAEIEAAYGPGGN
jgi:hypothetical protein